MIVALIPGYNEAPRIGPVIEAARAHLRVIVVEVVTIPFASASGPP